ncbi:MAG TPA: helix-turn-helix transcriptional regulator [Solirubrobacterales bacterium]|nr:helix-turn-helix transcriptional regulator [Solirubrobacterales bacterium]
MSDVARRFGDNLVRCRKAAGISQEELGFRASLHRTQIGCLERGENCPRIDTVAKLAGALEVPPGDLMDGIVWAPARTTEGRFIEVPVPGVTILRRFEVERQETAS